MYSFTDEKSSLLNDSKLERKIRLALSDNGSAVTEADSRRTSLQVRGAASRRRLKEVAPTPREVNLQVSATSGFP